MTRFCYIIIILVSLLSCKRDDDIEMIPGKKFTFTLTETEAGKINTLDLMAFKVNDNLKETFEFRQQIQDISDIGSNQQQFTIELKNTSGKMRFVLIANASAEIDNLGFINENAIKEEVLKRIIVSEANKISPNDIQMWGESNQINIINFNQNININLLRAVSRIDVTVTDEAQNQFKLKTIRVYNRNTNSNTIPKTDAEHWDGNKVLNPTIPANSGKIKDPIIYDELSSENVSSIKQIFLFESIADSNKLNTTCLVLGGIYNNEPDETYYRLDFTGDAGKGQDLLRNYLYNIRISKVTGSGFEIPEDAFNSLPINMEADITVWENRDFSDVIFDGQYMLAVSKSVIKLPRNAKNISDEDNKLTIKSDYPKGWTISKIVDNEDNNINWLTLNTMSGNNEQISILTQENNTGSKREANIHIKAWRMEYVVKVTQSTIPEIKLFIENSNEEEINRLFFEPHTGSIVPSQDLIIKWSAGSNTNIEIETVNGTDPFNFGSGDIITEGPLDGAGNKTYKIQPPPITQEEINNGLFVEKTYKVNFTVSNGNNYLTKAVYLTQKNFNLVPTIDANFVADGSDQYFTVKANAPWEIELTNNEGNVDQIITQQGGELGDRKDERIYFKTLNTTQDLSKTISNTTFTIKSTDPNKSFPNKTVTLDFYSGEILVSSNCYMIKTSNVLPKSYLIPVSRANEAFADAIGNDDKLAAQLVWTDDLNHVTTYKIIPVGRGKNGFIYIFPGTPQGNTIVSVSVNNIVKWSWHLWTINGDIQTKTIGEYTLMDRNIGALNNDPGNHYSPGVYFQWGRKDPFPPPRGNNSTFNERYYGPDGKEFGNFPVQNSPANLLYSVQNPLTYFSNQSGWTGSDGVNSWNDDGKKSLYDPSPPGWRVPSIEVWKLLNTSNFEWNGTSRGRNNSTAGWFPAAGSRVMETGFLTYVGARGSYWSYTITNNKVICLHFSSTGVDNNAPYSLQEAAIVRPIKE